MTPSKPPQEPLKMSQKTDPEIINSLISKCYSLSPMNPLSAFTLTEKTQEKENVITPFKRKKSNLKNRFDRSKSGSKEKQHRVRFEDQKYFEKTLKKSTRKKKKKKKMGRIIFSKLPLNLKKEFMLFLYKNKVEFEKVDHTGYVEAKVKLVSGDKEGVNVVLTKEDIDRLRKKVKLF